MNKIESYKRMKELLSNSLKEDATMTINGESLDKEFVFEILEFCRNQINK